MPKELSPKQNIDAGNAWYIDDQFAKQYSRAGPRAVIEARWKVFESVVSAYLARISSTNPVYPIRILDAGCGDGINLLGLSQMIERNKWPAELFGVDYNPLRVERVEKFAHVRLVRESRLESLQFPDGWFSIVICNQVLEHIHDEAAVLKELKRVVSQEGFLIIGVPNEGCLLGRLRNNFFQRSILRTTDHVNFYTAEQLEALLNSEDFRISKIVRMGFFMPHLLLHYAVSSFSVGRAMLRYLGKAFPSQCAELLTISTKQKKGNPMECRNK